MLTVPQSTPPSMLHEELGVALLLHELVAFPKADVWHRNRPSCPCTGTVKQSIMHYVIL